MRELIAAPVQLAITHLLAFANQCHCFRLLCCTRFKQLLHTNLIFIFTARLVPLLQQLVLFRFTQQFQLPHLLSYIRRHSFQHSLYMLKHARDRRFLVQVLLVLHRQFPTCLPLLHTQRQIEFRYVALDFLQLQLEITNRPTLFVSSTLESKHHLEQRLMTQVSFRLQLFHQLLKRDVLVRVCSQTHLTHTLQQLPHTLLLFYCRSQQEGVYEETDKSFYLSSRPAGDRCPNYDLSLAAVARQHHRKSRQHTHVHRQTFAPAQSFQLLQQLTGHPSLQHSPAKTLHCRSRMIRR